MNEKNDILRKTMLAYINDSMKEQFNKLIQKEYN